MSAFRGISARQSWGIRKHGICSCERYRFGLAGCEKEFREKITVTTADRPQLKKLMAALADGDVVIIPAVDRLSRGTTDLLVIARDMQRAGAGLRSIAEPVVDTGKTARRRSSTAPTAL
jgi:DNA invertase Pin-like site-specific DNA recombinase